MPLQLQYLTSSYNCLVSLFKKMYFKKLQDRNLPPKNYMRKLQRFLTTVVDYISFTSFCYVKWFVTSFLLWLNWLHHPYFLTKMFFDRQSTNSTCTNIKHSFWRKNFHFKISQRAFLLWYMTSWVHRLCLW